MKIQTEVINLKRRLPVIGVLIFVVLTVIMLIQSSTLGAPEAIPPIDFEQQPQVFMGAGLLASGYDTQPAANGGLILHSGTGEVNESCWSCHVNTDREMRMLHLAGGDLLPPSVSSPLCGQCHEDRYVAWQAGTHGVSGTIAVVRCIACHDPHRPQVVLSGLNKPQPPVLQSDKGIPSDAAIITGITVAFLLGVAIILTRHKEHS
ncbi:MAG: hypothetical protein PH343_09105 [Nitrospira sp.]|nr:hypothetical protein [Nitrospira sp.]